MKTITLKKSDSKFSALPGGLEERIKGTLGDLVRNHPYSTLADESGKFALVLGEFKLIFYTMSGKLVSIDIGATDMEAKPPVIPPAPAAQSIKIEPYQKIKHKMGSKDDFLFHTENMLRGKESGLSIMSMMNKWCDLVSVKLDDLGDDKERLRSLINNRLLIHLDSGKIIKDDFNGEMRYRLPDKNPSSFIRDKDSELGLRQ